MVVSAYYDDDDDDDDEEEDDVYVRVMPHQVAHLTQDYKTQNRYKYTKSVVHTQSQYNAILCVSCPFVYFQDTVYPGSSHIQTLSMCY